MRGIPIQCLTNMRSFDRWMRHMVSYCVCRATSANRDVISSDSKNPFCVVITNIEEDQFINYCGPTRTTQTVSYENLVTTGSTAGFPPTTTASSSSSSSSDSSFSTDTSTSTSTTSTISSDTATASGPSQSHPSDGSDVGQGSHLSTGAAVGIAVAAGVVAIILVLLLLWFVIRPRRQRAQIASALQAGTEKSQSQSVSGTPGPPHWMGYSGPVISEADSRPTAAPIAEPSPMPSTFSDPADAPRLSISADRAVGGTRKVRSTGSLVRPHDDEEETLAQRRARLYKQGTTSTNVSPVTPTFLPEADSRPASSGPSQASPHHISGISSLTSNATNLASSANVSPNPSAYVPYSPHWSARQQRGSTSTGAGGYLSAEDAMIPGRYWEAENGLG